MKKHWTLFYAYVLYFGPARDPPLKTTGEALHEKITANLLPNGKQVILKHEPENNPTRLLMVAVYLKLKKKFLNTRTQKECAELSSVNEKQLSKLVTGC